MSNDVRNARQTLSTPENISLKPRRQNINRQCIRYAASLVSSTGKKLKVDTRSHLVLFEMKFDEVSIPPPVVATVTRVVQMIHRHVRLKLILPRFVQTPTCLLCLFPINRWPRGMIDQIAHQALTVSRILQWLLHVRMPDDVNLDREEKPIQNSRGSERLTA